MEIGDRTWKMENGEKGGKLRAKISNNKRQMENRK